MAYIFDTNIFIRSKNEMPFDIWPTFWTRVAQLINNGLIFSCEQVKAEIERGNDELTTWIKENAPQSFFVKLDADILSKYSDTQLWANHNPLFRQSAKLEYAQVADAYLVAACAAKGHTLVTYEKSNPNCQNRVKIPDACIALDVRYCDLNTVFRELNIRI